jgi:hypothetical protein
LCFLNACLQTAKRLKLMRIQTKSKSHFPSWSHYAKLPVEFLLLPIDIKGVHHRSTFFFNQLTLGRQLGNRFIIENALQDNDKFVMVVRRKVRLSSFRRSIFSRSTLQKVRKAFFWKARFPILLPKKSACQRLLYEKLPGCVSNGLRESGPKGRA